MAEDLGGSPNQHCASVRQAQSTTRSLEQWNPDFRFELSKVVTDGGLRVTERIGGGCHRPFLCNSDQDPQPN
ncbi:hypothetical protein RE2895_19310 [Rhodococcus erythropolis]|nr:hypothetical protein RE2895_19310 [Rhodococcus erythropolis]